METETTYFNMCRGPGNLNAKPGYVQRGLGNLNAKPGYFQRGLGNLNA
jgi:hypothetical protein